MFKALESLGGAGRKMVGWLLFRPVGKAIGRKLAREVAAAVLGRKLVTAAPALVGLGPVGWALTGLGVAGVLWHFLVARKAARKPASPRI